VLDLGKKDAKIQRKGAKEAKKGKRPLAGQ